MNLIEIKDINAPEMDIFARVTERELRTMDGYFREGHRTRTPHDE